MDNEKNRTTEKVSYLGITLKRNVFETKLHIKDMRRI